MGSLIGLSEMKVVCMLMQEGMWVMMIGMWLWSVDKDDITETSEIWIG